MGIYRRLEDGYYRLVEKVDGIIPIAGLVDAIDKIVPSFAIFCLEEPFLLNSYIFSTHLEYLENSSWLHSLICLQASGEEEKDWEGRNKNGTAAKPFFSTSLLFIRIKQEDGLKINML